MGRHIQKKIRQNPLVSFVSGHLFQGTQKKSEETHHQYLVHPSHLESRTNEDQGEAKADPTCLTTGPPFGGHNGPQDPSLFLHRMSSGFVLQKRSRLQDLPVPASTIVCGWNEGENNFPGPQLERSLASGTSKMLARHIILIYIISTSNSEDFLRRILARLQIFSSMARFRTFRTKGCTIESRERTGAGQVNHKRQLKQWRSTPLHVTFREK